MSGGVGGNHVLEHLVDMLWFACAGIVRVHILVSLLV